MTTENYDSMNLDTDYLNWELQNANKQQTHEKNQILNKKYGEELADNEHVAKVTDDMMPYQRPLKPYRQPIAEVLEGGRRKRVLEQLKIQSKKPTSKNIKISYGPHTYSLAV